MLNVDYYANNLQFLTGKRLVLNETTLYVLPNSEAPVIKRKINNEVKIMYEVLVDDYLLSEDKKILDVEISSDIYMGMTIDEMNLLFDNNYLLLKDTYAYRYIYYFDRARLFSEMEEYDGENIKRGLYEDGVIYQFSDDYNQLINLQITSDKIQLSSGVSIGDTYEYVSEIYDNGYIRTENYGESDTLLEYELSDEVIITFVFNESYGLLERIYVDYLD